MGRRFHPKLAEIGQDTSCYREHPLTVHDGPVSFKGRNVLAHFAPMFYGDNSEAANPTRDGRLKYSVVADGLPLRRYPESRSFSRMVREWAL